MRGGGKLLAVPGQSVLTGYVSSPGAGNSLSSAVVRRQRDRERRRRREDQSKDPTHLTLQNANQLHTTLERQLKVAWIAVTNLLINELGGSLGRAGVSCRPPVVDLSGDFRSSRSDDVGVVSTFSSPARYHDEQYRDDDFDEESFRDAPSIRKSYPRRALNVIDHEKLWTQLLPEETSLDLIACGEQLREVLQSLRVARATLAEELEKDEAACEELEAEAAAGAEALEALEARAAAMRQERDACSAHLDEMLWEHAKIVDSSKALLDSTHSARRALASSVLR